MEILKRVLSVTLLLYFILPPKVHAFKPNECVSIDSSLGIPTALGCLSYHPASFIKQVLPWAVRLAGSIAFFTLLFAAFQYTTAAGDPEKMQGAQELLTSTAAGLLLIILSTILLRTIGVDVLGLGTLGF